MTEPKPLKISIQSVYGRYLYYPANQCAEAFALACGRKTLDARQLAYAVDMGHAIVADGTAEAREGLSINLQAYAKGEFI